MGGRRRGQATVEAVLLLPVLLTLILLLAQPVIALYTRSVMSASAHEACRLITTAPAGARPDAFEGFVRRRLGSIPPIPLFHEHDPCSYVIRFIGDESSDAVTVRIENTMRPVPLIGTVWSRVTGDGGRALHQVVEVTAPGSGGMGSR